MRPDTQRHLFAVVHERVSACGAGQRFQRRVGGFSGHASPKVPAFRDKPSLVIRALGLALVVAAANCSGSSAGDPGRGTAAGCTFTNPLGAGADPWVVRRGDAYYFAESRNNAIWIHKTGWLTTITSGGVAVWTAPASGWNQTNIWAPELHFIDGRWYIYYAAGSSGPPFITQHAGVLQSVTDDPQGTYTDLGMLY